MESGLKNVGTFPIKVIYQIEKTHLFDSFRIGVLFLVFKYLLIHSHQPQQWLMQEQRFLPLPHSLLHRYLNGFYSNSFALVYFIPNASVTPLKVHLPS